MVCVYLDVKDEFCIKCIKVGVRFFECLFLIFGIWCYRIGLDLGNGYFDCKLRLIIKLNVIYWSYLKYGEIILYCNWNNVYVWNE